jgi:hypothetical protein
LREGVRFDHKDWNAGFSGLTTKSRLTAEPLSNAQHHICLYQIIHSLDRPAMSANSFFKPLLAESAAKNLESF